MMMIPGSAMVKMMTRLFKIAIIMVVILNIFVLIESGIYMQKMTDQNVSKMQTLIARKDDLMAEQQRLELQIAELNQSLEVASANYKTQSDKLAALVAEEAQIQNQPPQATTPPPPPVQQAPAPKKPAPAPAPAPAPPVTRAS